MDVVERARDLFPWWAGPGSVVASVLLAFVVSYACAAAIAWRGRRALAKVEQAHWTQRARAAFLYRFALGGTGFGALIVAAWLPVQSRGELATHLVLNAATGALAAYLAVLLVRVRFEHACGREHVTVRGWLRSVACTWLLMWPHALVAIVTAAGTPPTGWCTPVVLTAGYALMLLAVYGGGLRVALALRLVRPASARVAGIAHEAAARLDTTLAGVYEVRHVDANAYALPHAGRLIYTDQAVDILDDAQLAALTAHEIGHLNESARIRAARLSGLLVLFPLAAVRPLLAFGGVVAFGLAVAASLGLSLLLQRVHRRMEERADAVAVADQAEPGVYARALDALYRVNLTPAVMPGKRQSHPHLYDRLEAAGVAPGYERPAPPRGVWVRLSYVAAVAFIGVTVGLGPLFIPIRLESESARWFALAWSGRSRKHLAALAQEAAPIDAVTLYAAGERMYLRSAYWPAARADTLLKLDRLEEAEAALREAARRADKYDLDPSYIDKVRARLARRGS